MYREIERGGGETDRDGETKIVDEEIQYHRRVTQDHQWGSVYYQECPHPNPLPSATSRTGRAGQTLKHRDVGQAARGGKVSDGSQLGRKKDGRRVTTVADGGQKTKHHAETEGRIYE